MIAWLLTLPSLAAPEVGAIVRPEVAVDLANDRDYEDPITTGTWIRGFASDETSRGDSWFVEGRLQHHAYFGDSRESPEVGSTSRFEGWWDLTLGETGWDGRLGGENSPLRMRAGALIERWGKLDLLPVLDVLNPRDARSGMLTPSDFQRLPIPMATLQIGSGSVRSETTLIPLPSADRLWLRGTDWSPIRQRMLADLYAEMGQGGAWNTPTELQGALKGRANEAIALDPSLRRGEDAATNFDSLPQALLVNGEIAQRLEVYGRNFDLALVGGALRSRQPVGVLDDTLQRIVRDGTFESLYNDNGDLQTDALLSVTSGGAIPVEMSWPRTYMGGLEASGLAGPLQIRGEAGYFTHRMVRQRWGSATTRPQLAAGLGVDYVRGSTFMATLEGRWQHLLDAPDNLVFSAEDQIQIGAGVRTAFAAERLILTLGGVYDATFSEMIARPSFAWRASDDLQLEVGLLFVEGFVTEPPDGLLDALNYEGGPASYFSQNDAVTFAVSWFL